MGRARRPSHPVVNEPWQTGVELAKASVSAAKRRTVGSRARPLARRRSGARKQSGGLSPTPP